MALPFVVQPRLKPIIELIGSEDSGQIEVERRGYLSVGEKAFVQQARTSDAGTLELIGLSRKVGKEFGMDLEAAYSAVVGIVSGSSKTKNLQKIEERFTAEIQQVISSLANSQTKEEMIMAAALLVSRVDQDFDIATISSIHPDLISGLAALYREEEAKNVERLSNQDTKEISIEEIEKKPSQQTVG